MPRKDRTGPDGKGPRTGRGLGKSVGNNMGRDRNQDQGQGRSDRNPLGQRIDRGKNRRNK